MNPQNYCSLEMSRKLVEAGIVVETDFYHQTDLDINEYDGLVPKEERDDFMEQIRDGHASDEIYEWIPAPSMAEIWRELPERIVNRQMIFTPAIEKSDNSNIACYRWFDHHLYEFHRENPCDALAELIICVKSQAQVAT